MVHKKFIKRGNKTFGPYLYENYRVNGKTKTRYLGIAKEEKAQRVNWKTLAFFILVFVLGSFLLFSYRGLTGKVTLDVASSYLPGETISGDLNLFLKSGELIPADAKIIIEQSSGLTEFLLSDLIDLSLNEGNFYADGFELSGSGSGFGFIGERKIYPEIDFELDVSDESESNSGGGASEEVVEKQPEEEASAEEQQVEETQTGEEVIEQPVEEIVEEPSEETLEEVISEPEQNEEQVEKTKQEEKKETNQEEKTEKKEEKFSSGNSGGESSGSSEESSSGESSEKSSSPESSESRGSPGGDSESSDSGGSVITGNAIKENNNFVSGKVSKGNNFEYDLNGKSAEIKKNSVKVDNKKIEDSEIELKISGGKAVVSTNYFETEQGFGKDYLGDKNSIGIDLSSLGIVAEQGVLKISLVYNEISLAEASKEISVEQINETEVLEEDETEISEINETEILPTTNETIEQNITEINQTILNETIIETNITELNETLINETLVEINNSVNFTTKQYKAVIGRSVKWIKLANKSELEKVNSSINIPKTAENISVKTDEEIDLNEIEEYENLINNENKINLITGKVTGNVVLEIKSRKGILTRFFEWIGLFTLTGNVISEEQLSQDGNIVEEADKKVVDVSGVLAENEIGVEYYTPAPIAVEENISNGKRITIKDENENGYENILAYTLIEGYKISINDTSKIKVYWNVAEEINEEIEETNETSEEIIETPVEVQVEEEILNESLETNETLVGVTENKTEISDEKNQTKEVLENVSLITGNVIEEINLSEELENETEGQGEVLENENLEEQENATEIQTALKKVEVNFTAYDLDSDGFVDYVEWIVPHLSEQVYEMIIQISDAEHLDSNRSLIENVYDFVKTRDDNWTLIPDGDYLRVTFETPLDKTRDITIYARALEKCKEINDVVLINNTEVSCEAYLKKKRIDEIRGLLNES